MKKITLFKPPVRTKTKWIVRVQYKNCGIGADGFEAGNDCASGDGQTDQTLTDDQIDEALARSEGRPLESSQYDRDLPNYQDDDLAVVGDGTDELQVLVRDSYGGTSGIRKSGPHEFFFYDYDEKPAGYARATKRGDTISFSMIALQEDFQGQGHGTDLYKHFLDDLGLDIKADSEQSPAAQALYRKLISQGYPARIDDDGQLVLQPKEQSKSKSADNCGTGAGGFKPGNDCAAGDGSGSEDESSEEKVELSEEQINAILAVQPESDNGQPWSTVDGKAKAEALEALSLLPEEQRNQELKKIFVGAELDRGFDPFSESRELSNDEQLQAVRVASVQQDDYLGSMANSNSNEKLRHASLTDSYIRTVREAAQKHVDLQMQDGGSLAGISEEKARAIVEASVHRTLVQAKPIDKETRGAIETAMSGSGKEAGSDAIPEPKIYEYMGATEWELDSNEKKRLNAEWAFMDDRRRGMIINAHETAVREYKILEDMSPTERYSHGMKRAEAAEAHFAKKGLTVKIDPRALIPVVPEKASFLMPSGDADEDLEIKQEHIQKMSAGYRELIALENASKDLKDAGFDTSSVAYSVRQRGGGPNATKNPLLRKRESLTRGWYHSGTKQITLPVDIDPIASKDNYTISGGTSRGVAIHETMHALHDQKLGVDARSPLANKDLSERALIRMGTAIINKAAPKSGINFDDNFGQRAAQFVAEDIFRSVRSSGYIDANVSKYASTKIVEYVAEVGAMSVTKPDRYKKLKSKKYNLRSMVSTLSEDSLPSPDLEAIKNMTITLADIYELAGGPTE